MKRSWVRAWMWVGIAACGASDDHPETCAASPGDCVSAERIADDWSRLAVPRPPQSAGWELAQSMCSDRLSELGYAVERHAYETGVNIVGRLSGTEPGAGSIVVSAHYDSVPDCAGADDNASGVAGALELARVLADGRYRRDLVVACWDEEESGYIGSGEWASRAAERGEAIAAAISLEMIGYRSESPATQRLPDGFSFVFPDAHASVAAREFRGDFVAFVADEGAQPLVNAMAAGAPDALPTVPVVLTAEQTASPLLGDLQRSDHASFWRAGYSAIMVTDTSEFRYDGYHCADAEDAVDRLDPEFAAEIVRATAVGVAAQLEPQT